MEIRGPRQDGNGDGMGKSGEEAKKRKKPHDNIIDVIRYFLSARVIISADKGWRLRAPDSSVRKARRLYRRIAPRG